MKAVATGRTPDLPEEVAQAFFAKRLNVRHGTLNNNELCGQQNRKTLKRERGYEEEKQSRMSKMSKIKI
jgi:hypothetical protein